MSDLCLCLSLIKNAFVLRLYHNLSLAMFVMADQKSEIMFLVIDSKPYCE